MASNSNAMSTKYISTAHLGYVIRDAADYPRGVYDAMDEVTNKDCWGAIVVNANATSAWRAALESGDASYDPSGAVGVFYQGARYYQIILLYLAPFVSRPLCRPYMTNTLLDGPKYPHSASDSLFCRSIHHLGLTFQHVHRTLERTSLFPAGHNHFRRPASGPPGPRNSLWVLSARPTGPDPMGCRCSVRGVRHLVRLSRPGGA